MVVYAFRISKKELCSTSLGNEEMILGTQLSYSFYCFNYKYLVFCD